MSKTSEHAASETKMASTSGEKKKTSRKRKRPDIPGFTPSAGSTPEVLSQAPRGINAAEFAEARALEISNMVEAIKDADRTSGKRLFQTLPRHMRRRAMSHNVKRMPARLRYRASLEMNNPANRSAEVSKKKSRRFRRKPKNVLEEYTRRQREHVWLETHIWHAKRMKMVDAWGYRLADHPNDKGFRAAYRAVKNSCILQDISFYGCVEVSGVQSQIIQAMSHLTSQEAGLTIGAKCYVNGSRHGNVMLYKFDQYPVGALSPVTFLWRQQIKTDTPATTNTERKQQNIDNSKATEERTSHINGDSVEKGTNSRLWVWTHPASFHSVFDAITEACSSVGRTSVKRDSKFPEGGKTDCIDKPGQSHQDRSLHSPTINDTEYSELKVISCRFELLRFRLTGPQSHALLASTLALPASSLHKDSSDKIVKRESTLLCKDSSSSNSSKWWQTSANDSLSQNVLWDRLKQASSPSVFPPGCAIGLTVLDPRLDLPVKKTSIASATEGISSEEPFLDEDEAVNSCEMKDNTPSFEHLLTHWPADVAGSHIWDESVRLEVKGTKIPEQELNRKRSELLVPGSQLELSEDEISHVPLLLIQKPGCSDTSRDTGVSVGYGSGWDIILPSGWAMAFWMALVYRGARTGGLQESQTLALEQGVPFFPNDFPDTPAGEAYNAKLKDDGEAQYRRYPPAKRPNYEKLGSKSPFNPPWRELVNDWSTSSTLTGVVMKTTGDATKTKIVASDSTQIDDSVVQSLSFVPVISGDSPTENTVGTDDPTRISSDIVHTKPHVIASNSSQMDDSIAQPLSVPVLTENALDSTKTNAFAGESSQMVGSIVQPLFYVLRSRSKLSTLRSCVTRYKQRQLGGSKHQKTMNKPPSSSDNFDLSSLVKSDSNSLVCVLLRMVNRSVPVPNSAVAIPSTDDTSRFKKCKDFAGPLEPLHKGPKAQFKSLRNSCTREIVGFASSGHYSLSRGCGFGIAFCALPGLVKLLSSSSSTGGLVVLVRGPSTQQYRFAHLTIM